MQTMKNLEIFYDIISPYAYLGLELFSRHNMADKMDVNLTPVSLGMILGKTGNPGPANIAPKRKVALYDFCMQCTRFNIPAEGPPEHPFNPMPATRFVHSVEDKTLRMKAALALNAYCWAEGKAVDTEEGILAALEKKDFFQEEWRDVRTFTKDGNGRGKLKEATARALELDIFGVPTFRYNGVNFWGSDRLDLLQDYIDHPGKYDNTRYEKMLNTPSGM